MRHIFLLRASATIKTIAVPAAREAFLRDPSGPESTGGPIQFLVAGAALVGSGANPERNAETSPEGNADTGPERNREVFLTLPGGARAQPLPR